MKNLKTIRLKDNLTQKEVSEALGIKITTYCGYETLSSEPNFKTAIKLADYFNVSIDYLLGRQQTNKIDLSNLNESQINLIKTIPLLNEVNLGRVEAYTMAKLEEQEKREENNNLKLKG